MQIKKPKVVPVANIAMGENHTLRVSVEYRDGGPLILLRLWSRYRTHEGRARTVSATKRALSVHPAALSSVMAALYAAKAALDGDVASA